MIYLLAFAASFVRVGLRAFQQLNVVHGQYWLIVPVSMAMQVCEVYIVFNIAVQGWNWPLILTFGIGAGLGCVCSMWIHKRVVQ